LGLLAAQSMSRQASSAPSRSSRMSRRRNGASNRRRICLFRADCGTVVPSPSRTPPWRPVRPRDRPKGPILNIRSVGRSVGQAFVRSVLFVCWPGPGRPSKHVLDERRSVACGGKGRRRWRKGRSSIVAVAALSACPCRARGRQTGGWPPGAALRCVDRAGGRPAPCLPCPARASERAPFLLLRPAAGPQSAHETLLFVAALIELILIDPDRS
jgi:hypothetical protein